MDAAQWRDFVPLAVSLGLVVVVSILAQTRAKGKSATATTSDQEATERQDTMNQSVMMLRDEGAYRVLAAAGALERQGKKIVHLEIGQPAFPTPEWVAQAGIDAITSGFTQYTNPSGLVELKQAIAKHVAHTRGGLAVTEANVVVGPGAKPGLWFAVQAVLSPGDEVLIPDPGFPMVGRLPQCGARLTTSRQYQNMAKVFGATPVFYAALGDVREWASLVTRRTKVIILNSPSNPTGRVLSRDELAVVAEFARKARLWVVSDEIYSHLTYSDNAPAANEFSTTPSIASLPGMLESTIIVDGFSKTFSMTGWRLGFVVCAPALAQRLHLLLTHAVGCTASFTQKAGVVALTHESRVRNVADMVKEYKRRRDYVCERLNAMPGVTCAKPEGAFYAFANVSGVGIPARDLCERCLHDGGVAILRA